MLTQQDIYDLADRYETFSEQDQLRALKILKDRTIELRMRPPDPQRGRVKGATQPQLDLWEAFFSRKYMVIAATGSNQSSKSDGVAVAFCKHIRDDAHNGDVFWVLAQSYNTLKDIPLKLIYQFLPSDMFPKGYEEYDPTMREIPTLRLKLPNNRGYCEIWWRSEDQGIMKLESARLNGIWWTECESQPIFDALLPRLVARNGWMLMDYVPFYGWHRTHLRERANLPGSPIWLRKFTIFDNRHNLEPGTIEKMKASMSPQLWEIRGLGKEAASQGAVYQNFSPELEPDGHMVKPFPIPDYWPLFLAGDWGFNAPHAFGLFTMSPNDTTYLVAEDYRAKMTVFETVEALWEMVHSIRPLRLYEGCRTASEMFEEMRKIDYRRRRFEVDDDFFGNQIDMHENPIREHVTEEFTRVIPTGCVVDTQIFQRHGSINGTLATEFQMAGLPVRPCSKKGRRGKGGFDLPGVETVRRLFDMKKLMFFTTCPYTRADHVGWMYKEGKDHAVLPSDRYKEEGSHGCDMVRYHVLSAPQFPDDSPLTHDEYPVEI